MNDDLTLARELTGPDDLRFEVIPATAGDLGDLRLKMVSQKPRSLTEIWPHLAALGVEVTDERQSTVDVDGTTVMLYDLGFKKGVKGAYETEDDERRLADAIRASISAEAEAGRLTALVATAGMTWQQVSVLRALSRYLQQTGTPFSQQYISNALYQNAPIAKQLIEAFEIKFDPKRSYADQDARLAAFKEAIAAVEKSLDDVKSLDHDRIIRMFVELLNAMIRTNAFAEDQPALAFKMRPRELSMLPEPRPMFEIFVYAPTVHGVHLRFGHVARGGLRWSDRAEDFRTEILGLVKAQMVKNTVIVPVGAKGGFYPTKLPNPAVDRQGWMDGGIAAYKQFVSSLLSVTDNIVDGKVVPPKDVIRYDEDDPYLVVAADKGTASFSDIANEISVGRGFWLGDAFASGGSVGYDHKGMGITAKGAWESVKRHFFEMGRDCQSEDFTCIGIGDMAGDVFGNGMMLSEHTKLLAAFNHMHIFIDPNPTDPKASLNERARMFHLPRSTWADYNKDLISAGGGIFERSAKSIDITPEMHKAFDIDESISAMTPTDLINALLKAPVDLLWNGGIGTYVKSSKETNAQVGDKANDALRVNGNEIRAKVIGEGGNLGCTQKGRIEFAQNGGRVQTDFIDNSAGVDTSDHEVNIKILFANEIAAGRLTEAQRNEILPTMTDDVAKLVLAHNTDQNIALSCATYRSPAMAPSHEAWMKMMEENGRLDRPLESLPSTAEMEQRIAEGKGLTRPELCSLLSWTKIWLADLILDSNLPDDPYLADRLVTYFPKALREKYAAVMPEHRLHREIISTVTVNRFVNSQGITCYYRLATETSSTIEQIVRAQLAARNILQMAKYEMAMTTTGVNADIDAEVRVRTRRLVERATRWLLMNRRGVLDIKAESEAFQAGVGEVISALPELLTASEKAVFEGNRERFVAGGIADDLATLAALAPYAHWSMPIVQIAKKSGRDIAEVSKVWFKVLETLKLDAMFDKVAELPTKGRWDLMAQAAMRDDLESLAASITAAAIDKAGDEKDPEKVVQGWLTSVHADEELTTLGMIADGPADLARVSVATRTLRAMLA